MNVLSIKLKRKTKNVRYSFWNGSEPVETFASLVMHWFNLSFFFLTRDLIELCWSNWDLFVSPWRFLVKMKKKTKRFLIEQIVALIIVKHVKSDFLLLFRWNRFNNEKHNDERKTNALLWCVFFSVFWMFNEVSRWFFFLRCHRVRRIVRCHWVKFIEIFIVFIGWCAAFTLWNIWHQRFWTIAFSFVWKRKFDWISNKSRWIYRDLMIASLQMNSILEFDSMD